ncbi:hypothetical protein FE257_005084 [Aspergillus nanangensis]|uniref:Uncharacterized protein n=1 Tax=Aspergillus nanangensis TaxID=2582783 RepID=A0AAD4GX35_ASPNN|nr:hypothetical protein FE257_005084 [Aspergillus nanangensis]
MFTTASSMPQFFPSTPRAPIRSSPLPPNNTYYTAPSTPTRIFSPIDMNHQGPASSPPPTTTGSSLFSFTTTTTTPTQTHTPGAFAPTTTPTSTSTSTSTAPQFAASISQSPSAPGTSTSTYAQRYATTISNPLKNASPRSYTASASPSARTARRNLFLTRVKQDRDAGRFENRGEQLVLMEDAAEQKKWGEAMRRRAGLLAFNPEEDDDEVDMDDGVLDEADARALDEYLELERAMEMEMVQSASLEGNEPLEAGGSFGDEEYEGIFRDLAETQGQDMDMSG